MILKLFGNYDYLQVLSSRQNVLKTAEVLVLSVFVLDHNQKNLSRLELVNEVFFFVNLGIDILGNLFNA